MEQWFWDLSGNHTQTFLTANVYSYCPSKTSCGAPSQSLRIRTPTCRFSEEMVTSWPVCLSRFSSWETTTCPSCVRWQSISSIWVPCCTALTTEMDKNENVYFVCFFHLYGETVHIDSPSERCKEREGQVFTVFSLSTVIFCPMYDSIRWGEAGRLFLKSTLVSYMFQKPFFFSLLVHEAGLSFNINFRSLHVEGRVKSLCVSPCKKCIHRLLWKGFFFFFGVCVESEFSTHFSNASMVLSILSPDPKNKKRCWLWWWLQGRVVQNIQSIYRIIAFLQSC